MSNCSGSGSSKCGAKSAGGAPPEIQTTLAKGYQAMKDTDVSEKEYQNFDTERNNRIKVNVDEALALKEYTLSGYESINHFLRTGEFVDFSSRSGKMDSDMKQYVKERANALQQSIDRNALTEDKTMYRGVSSIGKDGKVIFDPSKLRAGDKFEDKAIVSASSNPSIAKQFAAMNTDSPHPVKPVILKWTAKKGTGALMGSRDEQEYMYNGFSGKVKTISTVKSNFYGKDYDVTVVELEV